MFVRPLTKILLLGLLSSGCAANAEGEEDVVTASESAELIAGLETMTPGTITHLQGENRVLLGAAAIRGVDHEAIDVGSDEGLFSSIKLRVAGGSLALIDVKITLGNGDEFSPGTRLVFNAGQQTRDIYLPGNRRFIRKIEFKALEISGTPRIQAWGRTAETALVWEKIGTTKVEGPSLVQERIPGGSYLGPLRAVQIRVTGGDVLLTKIKITFGNDQTYQPHPRAVFRAGTRSSAIDLPGEARFIKYVDYEYANLGTTRANFSLFGLQD